MSHFSVWMGAGVVAAGVSAAMIAGADVASADTGPEASADSSASSADDDRTRPGRSQDASDDDTPEKAPDADTRPDGIETDSDETDGASDPGTEDTDDEDIDDEDIDDEDIDDEAEDTEAEDTEDAADGAPAEDGSDDWEEAHDTVDAGSDIAASPKPDVTDHQVERPLVPDAAKDELPVIGEPALFASADDDNETAATVRAATPTPAAAIATAAFSTAAAVPQRSLPDIVASLIFDFVGRAVTFIAGPPVVPRGSTVTVKTSTLKIDDEQTVPAHWYYPAGDEPPQRIIYLQHGFLGVGAMYSYTAANLAESTHSIVVVPTLTSNRNVADGFWLGSDQALRATSALFLGDREALTASAIAAGYAQRYGAEAGLPDRFALVGHSLGGNLVAGAAGYYAEAVVAAGEANQLAGVVLLDAAPQGSVLSDALVKLDGIGTYIPVLELGAPKKFRQVDATLNEHRPGMFNGIVLENGKHLDSMTGGTQLIQLISHLYMGFPAAANQAAAQLIIDGWVADILDGRIDPTTGRCDGDQCAGIYGDPGQTLVVPTPAGPTRGAVIGIPVPVRSAEFQPGSVTALVASRLPAGRALTLHT